MAGDEQDVVLVVWRCGRMDWHPAHEWPGRITGDLYWCPGHVVTEGGWPGDIRGD